MNEPMTPMDLILELHATQGEFERAHLDAQDAYKALMHSEAMLEPIRAELTVLVSNDTTYRNDAQRKAAFTRLLEEDHHTQLAGAQRHEQRRTTTQRNVERLEQRLKTLRSILAYQTAELELKIATSSYLPPPKRPLANGVSHTIVAAQPAKTPGMRTFTTDPDDIQF